MVVVVGTSSHAPELNASSVFSCCRGGPIPQRKTNKNCICVRVCKVRPERERGG